MAKDALGHDNIDKPFRLGGPHIGYGAGVWHVKNMGAAAGQVATNTQTGESFRGGNLAHISRQLDQRAADALASGPKSDPVPVHDSMAEKIDYAHNPLGLSRSEVNKDGVPNINSRSYGLGRGRK